MSGALRRFVVAGKGSGGWVVLDRKTSETVVYRTREAARRKVVEANARGGSDVKTPGPVKKVPMKRVKTIRRRRMTPAQQAVEQMVGLITRYTDLILDVFQRHIAGIRQEFAR